MNYYKRTLTLWLSILLFPSLILAQQRSPEPHPTHPHRSCQTDALHQERMQQDPAYRKHFLERRERMAKAQQQRSSVLCDNPVIIPVAVHFQNASNPDIACLRSLAEDQIQILNDDFQGLNTDITLWTGTAAASFPGISNGETCVEFCLATNYHPPGYGLVDGDPAVTINQGNDDFDAAWSGYLNVWVRNIGALGYSPLGGDGDGDGVTVDNAAFGAGAGCSGFAPGAPYDLGRTLTHEVGHYFNLGHIWGGGCGNDDGVADTPDSANSYGGCPNIGVASCGSTDMHMNYMDYVNDACMYMFSDGQSDRMETYVDNFLDVFINNDTVCTGVQARIQFVNTGSQTLEGTSSCNTAGTKTIPVSINISAGPTEDAVVTFQTTGTANAQDFSINPATITFTAGVASTQTVNIVLQEDAYVEGAEDIQLSYTIDPNGGDAVPGNSNQVYTLSITDDDFGPDNSMVTLLDENFNSGSTGWTINDGGNTSDTWALSTGRNGNSNNTLDGSQFILV
ncbi:MAG: M43 family zinc metalloprotease, partial [Bacteroidota bacterium]